MAASSSLSSPGSLAGRVALVTGTGRERGIGRAIALALGSAGATVVVNDVTTELAEPTVAALLRLDSGFEIPVCPAQDDNA